jgi:hypothetical protein
VGAIQVRVIKVSLYGNDGGNDESVGNTNMSDESVGNYSTGVTRFR